MDQGDVDRSSQWVGGFRAHMACIEEVLVPGPFEPGSLRSLGPVRSIGVEQHQPELFGLEVGDHLLEGFGDIFP
jgi:hypothetical protein